MNMWTILLHFLPPRKCLFYVETDIQRDKRHETLKEGSWLD